MTTTSSTRRLPPFHAPWAAWAALLLAWPLAGCATPGPTVKTDDPDMEAYVRLVLPARVKILEWTRPVSMAGDGKADALEAIVEVRDTFDDLTKAAGAFHFELQAHKHSDPMGSRVAFWPVEIKTEKAMRMYRDPLSRYYHFPLQFEGSPLAAGRYTLSLWLHLPTGQRLYDEYELNYDGSAAPPPSSF